jgi:hypothetical protein
MDALETMMAKLVDTYWGRPAVEAELIAMAGEVKRDAAAIAPSPLGNNGGLFNTEPAHYDALMLKEAGQ